MNKSILLAGNPNVGKSTIFNSLTGMNQHTGNWTGKTVENALGYYQDEGKTYTIMDVPGTYSLLAQSKDEEVARDVICFGTQDYTIITCDSTCLEHNLNLVLQILETKRPAIVCLNLMDEARRKGINIDLYKLEKNLGVPVVGTSANRKDGIEPLTHLIKTYPNLEPNEPINITYNEKIETAITKIETALIKDLANEIEASKLNLRWLAIKILENNPSLITKINETLKCDINQAPHLEKAKKKIKKTLSKSQINLEIATASIKMGETIAKDVTSYTNDDYLQKDRKIDKILTSKILCYPLMITLLFGIFWLTITGANYPSTLLANGLFYLEDLIKNLAINIHLPSFIYAPLIDGIYHTLAWVVSVMLPPMAIFFPLFTLLEDIGYLPRVAFVLDNQFRKCNACGKQALSMCMGFGCNAAGVVGCRIIDSPRERLIAILTNALVPCNGRFPTLIAIITMFFVTSNTLSSLKAAAYLTLIVLLGIALTFISSKILSKTLLKGLPSAFILELPPYRKPQLKQIIVRSIFDRTLTVLKRAIIVAIPAGLIIWLMANIEISGINILTHTATFLDPIASLIGLDGVILLAFILGMPANEIVLPIIIMTYLNQSALMDIADLNTLKDLLINNGWTTITAISTMLFSLAHWPCSTTLLTIKKETNSRKWTIVAFLLPTLIGITLCLIFNTLAILI